VHEVSAVASIALGILAMLGYGVADFIAKIILSSRNAIRTVLISQAVGAVPFLAVALSYDRAFPGFTIACLALIEGAVAAVVLCSYYLALSLGKASVVAPISSCLTAVAIVLSVLILGESFTRLQFSLIVLVFAGILLVAFEKTKQSKSSHVLSIALALVSALLGGGNVIILKLIAVGDHYLMALLLTRVSMLGCLLPLTPVVEKTRTSLRYGTLALLGLIDVFAFFAWYLGLRVGTVSIVTPVAMSSPAVTVVLAHIFLNERVQSYQRAGIVAIITGIVLLSVIS
jgi:drug/metabolite transporter (DMT)-like permease